VGLYGHIDQDIPVFFKDWGFDYVKVDACGLADYAPGSERLKAGAYRGLEPLFVRGFPNRSDIAGVRALYQHIADAIDRARPAGDYVYSICAWGQADVRAWGKEVGNLWRTSDDLTPSWTRMLHTFDSAAGRALYAHPGHWNDPDMLFVGKGDFDLNHLTEAKTHFSLWAIESAPLIIGYDLRNAPKPLLDIFSNADIVAVDQDPAGNQGVIAYSSDDVQIIVKTLSDGSKAVVLFNRGLKPISATLSADQLKFAPDAPIALKDLWSKETLSFKGEHGFSLAPRESRMFVARGERALKDGVYLSEIPGSINVAVDGVVRPELDPTIHRMVSPWAPGTHGSGERPFYTGWGGAQADAAPYGTALQVAGHEFRSGLGLLAGSRIEVRNAGYRRFHALVGVDDNSRNPSMRVRFYVYGDGKLLKASGPVKLGDPAVALDAPVADVKLVELVARPERAELTPASVAWGEASLSR
jgi:hypothetical protein